MNPLQIIEQQFNFRYPPLYHQLYTDGMLEWGTRGPTWITGQYPLLRENPPLLLFANDFELTNLQHIAGILDEWNDPDYWMHIKTGLRFIPFAQNGAGDMYCFFPTEQQDEDIPIVFLWHDANRTEYKAKNLQDFIFKCMLEAVADIEEAEYGLLTTGDFTENRHNFLKTHQKYLTPEQQHIIEKIYQAGQTENPLISAEELVSIIHKEIGFEKLDLEFPYQQE
ncbi:MAG TPA: SMI1/KNR4 family protein [Niastella sp.]